MTDINLIKMMAVTNLHHMSSLKKSVEQVLKHKNNYLKDFYMYMNYQKKALDNIIKIDKQILQSSNGREVNKLAKVENENCNKLYRLNRKEVRNNMNYRNHVIYQINQSKLPQSVKNMLMSKINKIPVSMGNTQSALSKNLKIIVNVQILLNKYKHMFATKKTSQTISYASNALTSPFEKIMTLEDLPLKTTGNNIFDFIADAKDINSKVAHDAVKDVSKMKNLEDLDDIAPEMFKPKVIQSIEGLIYRTPSKKSKINNPKFNKAINEQGKILYELNHATNIYLKDIGIIKGTMRNGYKLTNKGINLFANTYSYLLSRFSNVHCQPTAKYANIMVSILLSIWWIANQPQYNKYYGIALLNNIIDVNTYAQCATWSVPQINQYGSIQKDELGNIQYHKAQIGMTPMGYIIVIGLLLEKVMINNDKSHQSLNKYINRLSNIDKQANQLFID